MSKKVIGGFIFSFCTLLKIKINAKCFINQNHILVDWWLEKERPHPKLSTTHKKVVPHVHNAMNFFSWVPYKYF